MSRDTDDDLYASQKSRKRSIRRARGAARRLSRKARLAAAVKLGILDIREYDNGEGGRHRIKASIGREFREGRGIPFAAAVAARGAHRAGIIAA